MIAAEKIWWYNSQTGVQCVGDVLIRFQKPKLRTVCTLLCTIIQVRSRLQSVYARTSLISHQLCFGAHEYISAQC